MTIKRILDAEGHVVREVHFDDPDDIFSIRGFSIEQNCDPVLAHVGELRDMFDGQPIQNAKHVAEIPIAIYEQWLRDGSLHDEGFLRRFPQQSRLRGFPRPRRQGLSMAISNLPDLRLALSDWMTGQYVAGQLDTFIALAESEFSRKLRCREMLRRSSANIRNAYTTLPADFLQAQNITLQGATEITLRMITMDMADYQRGRLKGRPPEFAVISGKEIEVVPAPQDPASVVEMVYYARVPSLSDVAPTNWLLSKYPDLYLNAALCAAQPYLANPTLGQFHRTETDRILEDIRLADANAQFGASPLLIRPRRSL
jgi:hypothetical protein